MRINVRVIPRSKRNSIAWTADGLRVHLTAPPVDGAANDALLTLLAQRLGISKRDISLVHGATGRQKIVEVIGITPSELERRLSAEIEPKPDSASQKL
jgi:uncharacterized protein (TIGR00251 family)